VAGGRRPPPPPAPPPGPGAPRRFYDGARLVALVDEMERTPYQGGPGPADPEAPTR